MLIVMTSKRKSTLDQIAEFLKPASEIGSDDDVYFDTTAKVIEDYEDEFGEKNELSRPRLKQSDALDDDPRYIGKRVSRRDAGIAENRGCESSEASDNELLPGHEVYFERNFKAAGIKAESDNDSEGGSADSISRGSQESETAEEYGDSERSENDEDDDNDDDYRIMGSVDTKDIKKGDEEGQAAIAFQHMSSVKNVELEIEKGKAVKNQLSLWDNFLECRIHLQKCIVSANRLPKCHNLDEFKQEGGIQFYSEMKKTQSSVSKLLDKFVELQETLVNNYSETRNLGKKKRSYSDNEISSEDCDQEENEESELEIKPAKKKKRHCKDYEDLLNAHHGLYLEYRDATIQKWNDRTRLITGKASSRDFSAFEQSTLQQIRHILSNRVRLLQRTRIPRTVGPVLGDMENENSTSPDYDPEIFDDSDFYHQLLRELIERRTDDSQDSTALGQRWAALQKLRTKMKRKVDTRATKGRRLRYDPHQKLVGFMAPTVLSNVWSEKATTDLFSSLFGKQV